MTPSQKTLVEAELVDLRSELHDLKSCQVEFLKLAATATGAIFGIWGVFGRAAPDGGVPVLLALAPLMIILPTWWVFFDKATTVTRIVGYKRILEGFLLGLDEVNRSVGWC